MDHSVNLDKLPEGFKFPADIEDRFHFDADGHTLSFRGYMSKVDFDRVSQLTNDWKFRRTLEDLFRQCVPRRAAANGRNAAIAGSGDASFHAGMTDYGSQVCGARSRSIRSSRPSVMGPYIPAATETEEEHDQSGSRWNFRLSSSFSGVGFAHGASYGKWGRAPDTRTRRR